MAFGLDMTLDDAQAQELLDRLLRTSERPQEALHGIAGQWRSSVAKNFRAGGRPRKWAARSDGSPATLSRTSRLQRCVGTRVLRAGVKIGTRVRQARLMQEGGTVRPRRRRYLSIPVTDQRRLQAGAGALFRRYPDRVYSTFPDGGAKGYVFIKPSPDADEGELVFVLVRKVTVPARPFLMAHDEDINAWIDILETHLAVHG